MAEVEVGTVSRACAFFWTQSIHYYTADELIASHFLL